MKTHTFLAMLFDRVRPNPSLANDEIVFQTPDGAFWVPKQAVMRKFTRAPGVVFLSIELEER